MTAAASDPADAPLLRAGGVSALLLGLGYLVIFPLYAKVGAPPSGGGEAFLHYLAGKTSIWWAILWISVVTDLLFVPVGLALFVALIWRWQPVPSGCLALGLGRGDHPERRLRHALAAVRGRGAVAARPDVTTSPAAMTEVEQRS